MGHLPKINFPAAQTSKNLFLRALMRQWYSGCFSFVMQFFLSASAAILLQFFLRAAMSHSFFDVGHDSTTSTLLTASIQSSFAPLGNYFKKFKTDIMFACPFFESILQYESLSFVCRTIKFNIFNIKNM